MLFEDTTILLLWIACTYAIVQVTFGLTNRLSSTADELERRLLKHLDEIVHRVEIEKRGDIYYWYDQDNHKFLAQGQSDQEIISILKTRFPQHIFYFESTNHILCAKHNWEPQIARLPNKPQ